MARIAFTVYRKQNLLKYVLQVAVFVAKNQKNLTGDYVIFFVLEFIQKLNTWRFLSSSGWLDLQ
jgi:hypothetical protein